MDSNKVFSVIQQGFRTVVGATSTVVETIQDPEKREQTLSQLNQELSKKAEEWAQKGEVTEKEARRLMENFIQKQKENKDKNPTESTNNSSDNVSNVSYYNPNSFKEIQELTEAIISLRSDLEQANKSQVK